MSWTDDVTFQVLTMTGHTISITCPEMHLVSEVHELIKSKIDHMKDKDLRLCKDIVVMEPHETLLLHNIKPGDVLTVVVLGITVLRPRPLAQFFP